MDFKLEVGNILSSKIEDIKSEDIISMIEIPPNSDMGDYAFPCFKLAKIFRKSPNQIAQELSSQFEKPDFIEKIENAGGYVNFYINKTLVAKQMIDEVFEKKEDFGKLSIGNGKNVIVEYSSPNIAKPFHIGHIRTTVIGHALYNLYKFLGYNTIGINHLGDYGTQFGKLIVAYKKWGNEEEVKQEPIQSLLKLYIKFHEEVETDPSLDDDAREWFRKLEDKDEEASELWKLFRDVSLEEFSKVYEMLGIKFDSYAGESFYSDKMPKVLDLMEEKGVLVDSQGAKIVDLEEYSMPPALIKKKDGSTLYITRDLAAAIYRKETYDFYKNIYVVGSQQTLHFKQWMKILEVMGYEWAKDCEHVQFGMVSLEEGTLSTRRGRVVFLEDVLNKAIEKTREIISEKNPNLDSVDQVAKQVGVGAVVFQELSNSRIKDYTFSWERTLSFEGETGPYVQYTHARACSLIKKANIEINSDIDFKVLSQNKDAMEVIRVLGTFKSVLIRSAERNEPHHVSRFVLDLSQAFNKFYHDNLILVEDENIKKALLALVEATRIGIKNSLNILGMEAPEKM
ncbi:arginyl-tRNA synthetase [Acetoanaerobium pronyense]|uniref:Arginine--tRNA ligase n=1 Tax=Acetoanaerobium pronyense TaxID=1482736 RepID=A0ABS4KGW3_9FIRM|nr:arginine--tRNA ligase [Acetoanaerobium pronyense]MBP2027027.1 arginyl-tRNA synthetase [Acetoanaerobium pronyense]